MTLLVIIELCQSGIVYPSIVKWSQFMYQYDNIHYFLLSWKPDTKKNFDIKL